MFYYRLHRGLFASDKLKNHTSKGKRRAKNEDEERGRREKGND